MTDLSTLSRNELIFLARILKESERYDDWFNCMNQLVLHDPLTSEIFMEFITSCRNKSGRLHAQIKTLNKKMRDVTTNPAKHQLVENLRFRLFSVFLEAKKDCFKAFDSICAKPDLPCEPDIRLEINSHKLVFFLQLLQDKRLLEETNNLHLVEEARQMIAEVTESTYYKSLRYFEANLIRINTCIARFFLEIEGDFQRGSTLAKDTFEKLIDVLDTISEEVYIEVTKEGQILRDLIVEWDINQIDE